MTDFPADLLAAVRDRYRLERELGRGGMATVYLAEDLRHHRRVALKVLHPDLSGVLGAERFLREIGTVASLRHPNIMPLYDSGGGGGTVWYVMPLAEGESLRDRLSREQQLPVDEALGIAAEVADALAYAHVRGIVHRDIKPENILLESGHAVVSDFGLARAVDVAGGDRLTATGIAVGTPAYMSPEQVAGGEDVDGRSDLYSLGCVLYEMLAGAPPFTGPTAATVVQQHMVAEPRLVSQLRPSVPADVAETIARALAKVPADRWRDAAEMKARLNAHRMRSGDVEAPRLAAVGRRRRWIWAAAAAAGAGVLGALAFSVLRGRVPTTAIGRRTQVTLAPGLEMHPALSPNGELLAYAAGAEARVFVRQVEGGTAVPVAPDLVGLQGWPHWSPDGKQLAFASMRGIEIVPALGGAPRLLVAAPPQTAGGTLVFGGPWSPDGSEVAFVRGDTLFAARVEGGAPRMVFTAPRLHSCAWSPDGERIACVSGNREAMTPGVLFGNLGASAILVAPARGGAAASLLDDSFANGSPAWLPDGTLLFVSNRDGGRDVYAVRVASDGRARGRVSRVTTGLDALSITVPANGSRLGYAAFRETSNIWSMPIPAGAPGAIDAARQVTRGSQVIEWFDISRDGRWLVFDSDRTGNSDVYRMPLGGAGEPERLTTTPVNEFYPILSRDGREIAFHTFRDRRQIFVMPAEGGAATQVVQSNDDDRMAFWTPDGRALTFLSNYGASTQETRIVRRGADGRWGAAERWRRPPCIVAWSPDGNVGACADLTGHLIRVNARGDSLGALAAVDMIPNFGQFPEWSADGRTVYYLGVDSVSTGIYAAPVDGGPARLVLRFDDPTRPWHRFGFKVAGGRFYFTLGDRESHVWVAEMRR